ncbi:hypothetical protein E2562_011270 [Oryza meyeriana var. granulata]|uniref:Uncharacterized protein n=1 Tax=Oryza meyeriana var. granulata TaxID=110450 RepID=A0A6G1BVS2_9ORYZ|nr:hypothetical protein E2562_011270 [Oryza meyeriana var. granulata]
MALASPTTGGARSRGRGGTRDRREGGDIRAGLHRAQGGVADQRTDIVYATFLWPLVMQYEPNIEKRLRYLRVNATNILIIYLKNFIDRGYGLLL